MANEKSIRTQTFLFFLGSIRLMRAKKKLLGQQVMERMVNQNAEQEIYHDFKSAFHVIKAFL